MIEIDKQSQYFILAHLILWLSDDARGPKKVYSSVSMLLGYKSVSDFYALLLIINNKCP